MQASIEALGLRRQPLVTDGSHVRRAKPAPDLLLSAARQTAPDRVDTWYVGDSRWDMPAAGAAGMTPIGVANGAVDEARLRATGATRSFASLVGLQADLASRLIAEGSIDRDRREAASGPAPAATRLLVVREQELVGRVAAGPGHLAVGGVPPQRVGDRPWGGRWG